MEMAKYIIKMEQIQIMVSFVEINMPKNKKLEKCFYSIWFSIMEANFGKIK